jgi:murein L,D-transpeptidase YcbB/YkuD
MIKPKCDLSFAGIIGFLLLLPVCLISACNDHHVTIEDKKIVAKAEDINISAEDIIEGTLKDVLQNNRQIEDSFQLKNASILQYIYNEYSFQPIWSKKGSFLNNGDSLFRLMDSARNYGLFSSDYYYSRLGSLKKELKLDTSSQIKLDASKWAYSDLLLTSAFVQIVKDLSRGRLLPDSLLATDSLLTPEFFSKQLKQFGRDNIDSFTAQLEPVNPGYRKLKNGLKRFLSKAHFKNYFIIKPKDSLQFPELVYKRLSEEDSTLLNNDDPDSVTISRAIKKYQKKKGLKADGLVSQSLVDRLNDTDKERFIRIAITLDKYKMLQRLPQQYIWVNIPAYYLQLIDSDSVVLKSRVVVGKPETKTPLITSAITDLITYPKWHIPESIIKKDILPGLKRDPGYTIRKGYTLFDEDGNEIDPYTITWAKYKESIPYSVVQGSGDENALGVMKFNFPNKYAVYLHDTNQRYLFSKSKRALSHGCVRVQAWQELTNFILRNDSLYSEKFVPVDSVNNWLALKEKHLITVRKKIPLFIRYFTCDVVKDDVIFYEDVYGDDRRIREKIFSDK